MKCNKNQFLRRFVTTDETHIHHYAPESKQLPAEWLLPGESHPRHPKTQHSADKIVATEFWDSLGIFPSTISNISKQPINNIIGSTGCRDQRQAKFFGQRLLFSRCSILQRNKYKYSAFKNLIELNRYLKMLYQIISNSVLIYQALIFN